MKISHIHSLPLKSGAARIVTGESGFDSRQGLGIFLFDTLSRPAIGPTQPLIQWVPGSYEI